MNKKLSLIKSFVKHTRSVHCLRPISFLLAFSGIFKLVESISSIMCNFTKDSKMVRLSTASTVVFKTALISLISTTSSPSTINVQKIQSKLLLRKKKLITNQFLTPSILQ